MFKKSAVISLIVLLVAGYSELLAQSFSHTIQSDTAYCKYESDIDHAYSTIHNESSDSLLLDVLRTKFQDAPVWLNGMCIDITCYYTNVDSVRVLINPKSSISFRSGYILNDDATATIAKAHFKLKNVNNPAEILEFTTYGVNQTISTASSTQDVDGKIILFPNPALDFVQINSDIDIEKMEVYNSQGRLIFTTKDNYLNLEKLSRGIYYTRIETANGFLLKKIIKQ